MGKHIPNILGVFFGAFFGAFPSPDGQKPHSNPSTHNNNNVDCCGSLKEETGGVYEKDTDTDVFQCLIFSNCTIIQNPFTTPHLWKISLLHFFFLRFQKKVSFLF